MTSLLQLFYAAMTVLFGFIGWNVFRAFGAMKTRAQDAERKLSDRKVEDIHNEAKKLVESKDFKDVAADIAREYSGDS